MLTEWLQNFHPVTQAFFATLFTWALTAAGSALVVFTKNVPRKLFDGALGLAAGVMIAASFWSLLAPAIDMAEQQYGEALKWMPPLVGFVLGAVVLRLIDMFLPHLHPGLAEGNPEGLPSSWRRSTLLVLAITIHNIPEGLAVGVAFGAAALAATTDSIGPNMGAAIALAVGIGIQNFPEGAAVSLPLRREGMSRAKSFWYGQLSGMVEPMAGVLGAFMVLSMSVILPYALAFAAGAMIFVVVEELIPESQSEGNVDLATMGAIAGFSIMMTLDVALG